MTAGATDRLPDPLVDVLVRGGSLTPEAARAALDRHTRYIDPAGKLFCSDTKHSIVIVVQLPHGSSDCIHELNRNGFPLENRAG